MSKIKELLRNIGINDPDVFVMAWISHNAAQFAEANSALKSQDFNAYMALQVQAIILAAKKAVKNS